MSRRITRENYRYVNNTPHGKMLNLTPAGPQLVENFESSCNMTPQKIAEMAPQYGYPYANFQPPRPPTREEKDVWAGVL